ncbi:MAG: hypothetical protein Tsb0027_12470 [Wenzhouxiangellaceae bacterium]
MLPAARIWCREQMLRQHPQWPLLEAFLPPDRRDDLLLLSGVLAAMLQSAMDSSSPEVAAYKLGWWADAMQQLQPSARLSHHSSTADADQLAVTGRAPPSQLDVVSATSAASSSPRAPSKRRLDALATNGGEESGIAKSTQSPTAAADSASLQHPALQQLRGDSRSAFFQRIPLVDWLHDLQRTLEPPVLADVAVLRAWCWRLARPMDWLDIWLQCPAQLPEHIAWEAAQDEANLAAASVHARSLLLQQINTLPRRNWLYHNLPMTLRARHGLQLDAMPPPHADRHASDAPAHEKPLPPWHCPGALLSDLLAVDAQLSTAVAAGQPLPAAQHWQRRMWQAGNRVLAQRLQRRTGSGHDQPCSGITPGLAWSYWRIARQSRL